MKKLTLLPALAAAAFTAATLSLPATAAADSLRHGAPFVTARGPHPHEANLRPVHNTGHHYHHGHRWSPPHPRDRGHHFGHQHRHAPRYAYPPVRYEHRSSYGPVERYEPRHDGDVRVRISYDLHL